jgi:Uma2 family endonuclease
MMAMVSTSRREHGRLTAPSDRPPPSTPRELFDALPPLPGLRTEIIDGKLIVSPVGTPEHGLCTMRLYRALIPVMDARGWEGWTGNVDVCVEGPRDPVEPDFVLAPADCPRWGERELLSSGLIMVAEVVSSGSTRQDRQEKPHLYALGGVPVFLLIDPLADPPAVTAFSDIRQGAYQTISKMPMGGIIELPDPVGVKLDTSIFRPAAGPGAE